MTREIQRPSSSRNPSVDSESLTTDPLAPTPCHVQNGFGNFLRLTNSAERTQPSNEFQSLLGLAFEEQFRGGRTGSNSVDDNSLTGKIFAHKADHLLDSAFACHVEKVVGRNRACGYQSGGDKNNMRAGWHMWDGFLLTVLVETHAREHGVHT